MTEEEFTELISGELDVNKDYDLMKKFFKKCLYTTLGDSKTDKQMRKLFINIIYNGFQQKNYPVWSLCISKKTKTAIIKGITEKRLKDEAKKLFNSESEIELNIQGQKKNKNDNLKANDFIEELSKKWKNNEQKSKNYYDEIKKLPYYEYVIIGEDAPYGGAYLLGNKIIDKKGPYYIPLNNAFKGEKAELIDALISNKVLFFDLLTIPLPISSDLRKGWSTEEFYNIAGKQLPVFLLEVAFEHFDLKNKINDAKIAIMMPTKTSSSIYNYYEQIKSKDDLYCLKERLTAKSCWNEINDYHQTIITNGKCFNYYKSNTISGSNTPDVDLLKYALNITHETITN